MEKIKGFLRMVRPINCAMMGFAVLVGALLTNSQALWISWRNITFGFLTGFLLTAASMVVNDYYDREIDAINEPTRPIPSGLIKPKEALTFALILSILGLTTAFLTNISNLACFTAALFFLIVSVTYVTVGKKTGLPGNFLVSLCVSAPFIYGSLTIADEVLLKIWIFVAMVFLSNTGREITKGIVDIEGDRARGVKTIAVRRGARNAGIIAVLFYLAAVALSPLPWLWRLVNIWYVPPVALTDLGLIASSIMLLRDQSRENARKVKKQVLAWFLIGLIAFAVGGLS
ncbi:MAG: UbiA family prenyltransferase [Candidatus Bathyarchaeia archaeon]